MQGLHAVASARCFVALPSVIRVGIVEGFVDVQVIRLGVGHVDATWAQRLAAAYRPREAQALFVASAKRAVYLCQDGLLAVGVQQLAGQRKEHPTHRRIAHKVQRAATQGSTEVGLAERFAAIAGPVHVVEPGAFSLPGALPGKRFARRSLTLRYHPCARAQLVAQAARRGRIAVDVLVHRRRGAIGADTRIPWYSVLYRYPRIPCAEIQLSRALLFWLRSCRRSISVRGAHARPRRAREEAVQKYQNCQ